MPTRLKDRENKMTDRDFDCLYSFRDSVQEVRKEMAKANRDEKEISAVGYQMALDGISMYMVVDFG